MKNEKALPSWGKINAIADWRHWRPMMPSPFPGMDPYLEAPEIWPDFHDRLASNLSAVLNQQLPKPYYARLEMRPEIGILDLEDRPRRMVPDVAVADRRGARSLSGGSAALLDEPRSELSSYDEVDAFVAPIRHMFVELRDSMQDHKLITLIEIVSPSNKRPGKDRDAYLKKQQEIVASDASLVEIDLLRDGERPFVGEGLELWARRRRSAVDYLVSVNRSWQRERSRLYTCSVREPLPVIGIPLREREAEVPLDLQFVVNRAYDEGPYWRGAVNYDRALSPPLSDADAAWAAELVAAAFRRGE